jgi:hypothetical protein
MITTKVTALMVAAALTVAFLPLGAVAWADNTQILAISDDDKVEQENKAKVKQETENNAVDIGGGNDVNVAASDQDATVTQVNSNVDDDTFTQVASLDDRDVCGILVAFGIDC